MIYDQTVVLKNGKTCRIRSAVPEDGAAVRENFIATHGETEFLTSYPDECGFSVEEEAEYLKRKAESASEAEILALVDGKVVGTAGVDGIGHAYKLRHRASFGISVLREYWGIGIGGALLRACVDCAEKAGYSQLELEVVADNVRAIGLYKKAGFIEYGRNPMGFHSRNGGYQTVVAMRLPLDSPQETEQTVKRHQIFVGFNDAETKRQEFTSERIGKLLENVCRGYRVGFSISDLRGGYFHEDRYFVTENSACITLIGAEDALAEAVAKDLSAFLNQESVMVLTDTVNCRFLSDQLA